METYEGNWKKWKKGFQIASIAARKMPGLPYPSQSASEVFNLGELLESTDAALPIRSFFNVKKIIFLTYVRHGCAAIEG